MKKHKLNEETEAFSGWHTPRTWEYVLEYIFDECDEEDIKKHLSKKGFAIRRLSMEEVRSTIINEYERNDSDSAHAFNYGIIYTFLYSELSIEEAEEIGELQKLNRRLHYEYKEKEMKRCD